MKAAICKNYGPTEVLEIESDHSIIQVYYNKFHHYRSKKGGKK